MIPNNPLLAAIDRLPPGARYAIFGAGRFSERHLADVDDDRLTQNGRVFLGVIDEAVDRPLFARFRHAAFDTAVAEWRPDWLVVATDTWQQRFRERIDQAKHDGVADGGLRVMFASYGGDDERAATDLGIPLDRAIETVTGESLPLTIRDYHRGRPARAVERFDTLCHAPFTALDLGPAGQVHPCNHYFAPVGNVREQPLLDILAGEKMTALRERMRAFRIDESLCVHCARQLRSGWPQRVFAREQFDNHPAQSPEDRRPKAISFRLGTTCNLACVMCNGELSSRIRHEREHRPPLDFAYDEAFFAEIATLLPDVEYVEFFGGEPFLIEAHLRILDLIEQTGATCTIYANTNATVFTDRVKGYLERLRFTCLAVSMDAVSEPVLTGMRRGLDYARFHENLDWLLALRERKPRLTLVLNVTETRHNWFELPAVFSFAATRGLLVHINTCVHPADCTLVDLPDGELRYVLDFLTDAKGDIAADLKIAANADAYEYLLSLLHEELAARQAGRFREPRPARFPVTDGLLAVPPAGALEPAREIERAKRCGATEFAGRLATHETEIR
jgi:MoaA/NifB/PqqE/SkfB family radical SAM enzyme